MWKKLLPDMYINSIFELDPAVLQERNIRGIIADMDNTLIPWGDRRVYPRLMCWMKDLRSTGFSLHIVSNNTQKKGAQFASQLGVPACWYAVKPKRRAFRMALANMGLQPSEVAVIGDQIVTDILGGNRLGLFTILVKPMSRKEFFITKIMRLPELRVLRHIKKTGR